MTVCGIGIAGSPLDQILNQILKSENVAEWFDLDYDLMLR